MAVRRGSISQALDNYLEASKTKTVLVGPLEKYLMLNPPGSERSHKVLHPSEVVSEDWCPRYNQMIIEGLVEPKPETHRLRTHSIFAEGHSIHRKWQDWLGIMGSLYGLWRCTACGRKAWHLGRPEDLCKHGSECLVYDEVPLRHGLWGGHADGIVEFAHLNEPALLEIKSVGSGTIRWGNPSLMNGQDLSSAFSKINQPFEKHVKQIQIYMELANRMCEIGEPEMRPVQSCVVLYECKADQAVKEFVIKRDMSYVVDLFEYADEMEQVIGTGTLIACPWRDCKHDHD